MKFLYLLPLIFALSACSSPDNSVRLVGDYNDHKDESRYEIYIRKVNISEHTTLSHKDEPKMLSEGEIRAILVDIKKSEDWRALIRSKVQKDIDAGVALDLDEIKKYEEQEKKRFAEHEARLEKELRKNEGK